MHHLINLSKNVQVQLEQNNVLLDAGDGCVKMKRSTQSHNLLKEPRRKYLKEMLIAHDKLLSNPKKHFDFYKYWGECLSKKASPQNALLYAFKFYNPTENRNFSNEGVKQQSKKYLEGLKNSYKVKYGDAPKQFTRIRNFLGNCQKNKPIKVILNDINWFRAKNEENFIADEFDFAWKTARFWQSIEKTKEEQILKSFFCIDINSFNENQLEASLPQHPTSNSPDLKELKKTINDPNKNFSVKDLKKYISYFNPDFLNSEEMAGFLKKASISSIEKGSKLTSPKKPLEDFWLLGRYYKIHGYPINFLNAERGISERAFKQFSFQANSNSIKNLKSFDIENFTQKEQIKIGNKKISVEEYFATIGSLKNFEMLQNKSKEVLEGKESNPYKPLLEKVVKRFNEKSKLNNLDLLKIKENISKNPKQYSTLIIFLAMCDEASIDTFIENLESSQKFLQDFIYLSLYQKAVTHEKLLFFTTFADLDEKYLLILIIVILLLKYQSDPQNSNATPERLPAAT